MIKVSYFDYSALAVLLVLLITVFVRGMLKGRRNRYFLYVLFVIFLSAVFDVAAISLDNSGSLNAAAKYIAHSGYLILHNFSTPVFITYLVGMTGTEYIIRRNRVEMAMLALPFLTVLIMTLLAPVTGLVYYLDENMDYTRGPWFVLLYICAACYILYGAVYLFYYRRLFKRWEFIAGVSVFLAMPVAVGFQFFRPQVPVEMFSQAISALFIMQVLQRPEERLDQVTGFGKYDAYVSDMMQAFYVGKPLHIVLLHLKNYKWLNDLLGFMDTNDLLKMVAARVNSVCSDRLSHTEIYHLGRGMFSLAIEPSYFSQTDGLVQALLEEMEKSFLINHMDVKTDVQLCVIHCPEDLSDFQMLLSFCSEFEWQIHSGSVLYAADIIHKGNYEMLHHLDTIIEDAIVNRKFEVYYQPIYSLKEGRFHSAEALLRLKDEKYGFISPEFFIPAAERNGAIHRIGAYVLEEVCKFISSPDFEELGVDYIEVNLSTVQCMRSDLVQEVQQILEKYKVSPERINMEVTETAVSLAQNIMLENINQLAAAGIAISLDDFGTGYSNMQRVASLPLHIVKLDKAFTRLDDNPKLEIVVRNAIRMIKDMKLLIVAEGIETAEMVKQFADLDCEYIQGFYYSKPLPRQEFVQFIRQRIEA